MIELVKTLGKQNIVKPVALKVPWNMSKPILVGKRSDGYTIMQALYPLFDMGYSLTVSKGEKDPVKVTFFTPKGKPKRGGEGPSLSVALRRMSRGMSVEFSHMAE